MNIDLLKKHCMQLKKNSYTQSKSVYPKINIQIDGTQENVEEYKNKIFQPNLHKILEKYKNEIDNISNYKLWDFFKKLTNPFELIHYYDKFKNTNTGIANYNPISRSYFKMWEMIKDFNLIDFSKEKINILGIAEGPGGFIDCIYSMRKKYSLKRHDNCICMSLKSYKNNIPGWKNSNKLFSENKSIRIYYGKDNTGDLYKKKNIIGLKELHNKCKADIVTADGGFDFSIDYNKQEILAQRLIMCEIVSAFSCLAINGNFVIKIFDIFNHLTIKIIYFLTLFFENIYIVKPFTSRPANSEKYLVCKHFKGISDYYLNELLNLVDDWEILNNQHKLISDIFNFEVPLEFIHSLKLYNYHIVSNQIQTILKTLVFIKLNLNNEDINKIKHKQAIQASLWCKKYDITVNINCRNLYSNITNYNYIPDFFKV